MNNLEKLQEIKRLQNEMLRVRSIEGYCICFQSHHTELVFSLFTPDGRNSAVFTIGVDGEAELDRVVGDPDVKKAKAVLMAYLNTNGG